MTSQSARTATEKATLGTRIVLMAALLLAGVALSQVATAASDSIADCDKLETSLRSLDIPVEELTNAAVDPLESGPDALPSAGPAPVLLLTPRVAAIMREVFDALPIVTLDENGEEIDAKPAIPVDDLATVSDTAPVMKARSPLEVRLPEADEEPADAQELPQLQRQMYRTDI